MNAPNNNLSPAGSGSYSSNTLHVGDGTWDNGRDTFLLPNLVGLNFETMQYNGMGNRFKDLPEYHRLITGHGVLAAITFLGIVPAAVFYAKYGFYDRHWSMKMHVYLQILTLILSTIILILGWFAVGPERSLTNPHHGIGVAIYVMIWSQMLYGWLMARLERARKNPMAMTRTPTKVWIHKLFGRTIALLAMAQVPLGLTLYGSPKVLFILYALWCFLLLFLYLALDRYYFEKRPVAFGVHGGGGPEYYSDYGSYVSGTELTQDLRRRREEHNSHWGRKLLAAAGLFGAYETFKHRRMRKREEQEQSELDAERRHQRPHAPSFNPSHGPPMTPGGPHRPPTAGPGDRPLSPESWEDEKFHQQPEKHTWRDRLLGAGAGIAAFEGMRRVFGRQRRDDDYVDAGSYRPPLGGNHSFVSQTDVSRVQNGHAPFSPSTPGGGLQQDRPHGGMPTPMTPSRPPRRQRPSGDSFSYADDDSMATPRPHPQDESHTLRNSIATLGAIAGFREWNRHRKTRRERDRENLIRRQEFENEDRYNRRTSNNYPRPQDASGRRPSMSETIMTGASGPAAPGADTTGNSPDVSRFHQRQNNTTLPGAMGPDTMHPPLPAAAGAIPGSPLPGNQPGPIQGSSYPPPPPGPPPNSGRPADYRPPEPGSLQMPTGAVNPDPSRLLGSTAAAGAGMVTAMAAGRNQSESPSRYHSRQDSRTRVPGTGRRGSITSADASQPHASVAGPAGAGSPPVSLKMKVHNDGKHVTLRRLNEEEAAAERAARRQERRQRRRRGSSLSSGDEPPGSNQRYRRNDGPILPSIDQPITNVPPPPPMSSSAGASNRPLSELNLPPVPPHAAASGRMPDHSNTPPNQRPSPAAGGPPAPGVGSVLSGGFGSPGDAGTGTDVSAFADNRRRRRQERARRLEAARGTNRVDFE